MGFTYLHETAIKFDLFSICDQRFSFGRAFRELVIKGQKYRRREQGSPSTQDCYCINLEVITVIRAKANNV